MPPARSRLLIADDFGEIVAGEVSPAAPPRATAANRQTKSQQANGHGFWNGRNTCRRERTPDAGSEVGIENAVITRGHRAIQIRVSTEPCHSGCGRGTEIRVEDAVVAR